MVSVEIKYYNFESCSHQRQLQIPTNSNQVIHNTAVELFKELWNKEPVRLLGIRTSKLSEEGEPEQLTIFDLQNMPQKHLQKKKFEDLAKALAKIRQKYGQDAVVRGGQYGNQERNEKNHPVLKGH